jgi:hypothetical protein
MFNFLKRIFFRKNKNDFLDKNGNVLTNSAIYENDDFRFLKLANSDCAIVIHGDNNVEVVFTKLYDNETQTITDNEEELMALALFMKQPGFLEMIIDEFRKIAKNKITTLTK